MWAVIENAFGMLKVKFQSLQNLPIQVNHLKDMDKVASWILACIVLHNYVQQEILGELLDVDALLHIKAEMEAEQAEREKRVAQDPVVGPDPGAEEDEAHGVQGGVHNAAARAK